MTPAVSFVQITLDALDDLTQKHFLFLNESFVALLVEDGLEKDEYMFLLVFCQKGKSIPKRGLILLCQWFSIFHRKVSPQIVRH